MLSGGEKSQRKRRQTGKKQTELKWSSKKKQSHSSAGPVWQLKSQRKWEQPWQKKSSKVLQCKMPLWCQRWSEGIRLNWLDEGKEDKHIKKACGTVGRCLHTLIPLLNKALWPTAFIILSRCLHSFHKNTPVIFQVAFKQFRENKSRPIFRSILLLFPRRTSGEHCQRHAGVFLIPNRSLLGDDRQSPVTSLKQPSPSGFWRPDELHTKALRTSDTNTFFWQSRRHLSRNTQPLNCDVFVRQRCRWPSRPPSRCLPVWPQRYFSFHTSHVSFHPKMQTISQVPAPQLALQWWPSGVRKASLNKPRLRCPVCLGGCLACLGEGDGSCNLSTNVSEWLIKQRPVCSRATTAEK